MVKRGDIEMSNVVDIRNIKPTVTLSKYLQGQFSEHLGTGIYGGIWVGKDSDIENVKNFRQVHEMKSDYELLSEEEVEKFVKEIIEDEERKYKK